MALAYHNYNIPVVERKREGKRGEERGMEGKGRHGRVKVATDEVVVKRLERSLYFYFPG